MLPNIRKEPTNTVKIPPFHPKTIIVALKFYVTINRIVKLVSTVGYIFRFLQKFSLQVFVWILRLTELLPTFCGGWVSATATDILLLLLAGIRMTVDCCYSNSLWANIFYDYFITLLNTLITFCLLPIYFQWRLMLTLLFYCLELFMLIDNSLLFCLEIGFWLSVFFIVFSPHGANLWFVLPLVIASRCPVASPPSTSSLYLLDNYTILMVLVFSY